jgi:hypothetical protein
MVESSTLMVAERQAPSPDCPGESCKWTVSRVRWYLICWRLSEIAREPFPNILRSESRNSRDIDPWVRGGKVDPDDARDIGLSLVIARDHHGIALVPHNAERLSQVLCLGGHVVDREQP